MKICRFSLNGTISQGLVDGENVIPIRGDIFGKHEIGSARLPAADVIFLAPVVPPTFYAAGFNYTEHILQFARGRGEEPKFPDRPEVGYRAASALIGHDADIVKPADAGDLFQYEAELVAVIGRKTGKHVPRSEAHKYIFGWTIGNDVSERTWQRSDRTLWRAKNSDTFKPMGPWIITDANPRKMTIRIRINGIAVDEFDGSNMLFTAEDYIVEITKYITLHAGDVIWLGTDKTPGNIKPGDTVEIEVDGIGTLRNKVVLESDR